MDPFVRVREGLLRVAVAIRVRSCEAAGVPDDRPRRKLQFALWVSGLPQSP